MARDSTSPFLDADPDVRTRAVLDALRDPAAHDMAALLRLAQYEIVLQQTPAPGGEGSLAELLYDLAAAHGGPRSTRT